MNRPDSFPPVEEAVEAWRAGRLAALRREPREPPHPKGSPLARAWSNGWLEGAIVEVRLHTPGA